MIYSYLHLKHNFPITSCRLVRDNHRARCGLRRTMSRSDQEEKTIQAVEKSNQINSCDLILNTSVKQFDIMCR